MQNTLFPIDIIQQFPSTGSTADLRLVGIGYDNHQYALKTLNDSPLLPISEWVGHHLCNSIGISTPDFAIVKLLDQSLAFGSRWNFSTTQLPKVPSMLDFNHYVTPFKQELAEIYATDLFLPNEDRHMRNILYRQGVTGLVPLSFDFSRAWVSLGLPFGTELSKTTRTFEWWSYLKKEFNLLPSLDTLKSIEGLPNTWLEDVLSAAPSSWVSSFDTTESVNFWKTKRTERCNYARSLL